MPVHGSDFPSVASENTFLDTFVEVPDFNEIVVPRTHEFSIRRTKTKISDSQRAVEGKDFAGEVLLGGEDTLNL